MVIEDVTRSPSSGDGHPPAPSLCARAQAPGANARFAAPVDRMASLMADLILLLPLITVLIAPARRQLEMAILLGDSDAKLTAAFSIFLGVILGVVSYQTAFLSFWGTTPGKRLLGLRVVSVWTSERPTVLHAFLRSVTWCFEVMLLMIPWLSVLSNRRRRPWHDRIADTEVQTMDPTKAVGPPNVRETAVASSLRAAAVFAICGVITSALLQPSSRERQSRKALTANPFLCQQVTEAYEEWFGTEKPEPSRLDIALAMYGADAISEKCLEVEADFALWNGLATPASYLAKALARADDSENYVDYARRACEKGAREPACRLARLLAAGYAQDRVPAALGSLGPLELEEFLPTLQTESPAYLKIYAVRELISDNRFADAMKVIEQGSPHRKLGYFFASYRAQALWGLHRQNEARLAVRSSLEGLSATQRTALSTWLCSAENAVTCGEQAAASCDFLRRAVERDPTELEDSDAAVAWIRGEECVHSGRPDIAKMKRVLPGLAARHLLDGIERAQSGDSVGARESFEKVTDDSMVDSSLWFEAQSRLAVTAEKEADIEKIQENWRKSESSESGWLRLGHALLRRSVSLGLTKRTLEIGTQVAEWDPFDEKLQRQLVVWAFNAGDIAAAARALDHVQKETLAKNPAEPTRELASVSDSEFERIAKIVAEKRPVIDTTPVAQQEANP